MMKHLINALLFWRRIEPAWKTQRRLLNQVNRLITTEQRRRGR